MSNMLLHYDEQHFKQPDEFMPERWLKENIPSACPAAKASNPFVYLPFGFGPRSCVGKRFAEMEIYVLIARVLKQYRIEFDYGPLKYRVSFVLSPISDLKFKITEIWAKWLTFEDISDGESVLYGIAVICKLMVPRGLIVHAPNLHRNVL